MIPGKAIVAATEETLITAPPCPAAPVRTHRPEGVLDARGDPEDVDLQHQPDVLRVEIHYQRGDLDTGIVDQQVESTELGDRAGDRRRPAVVIRDIQRDEPGGGT